MKLCYIASPFFDKEGLGEKEIEIIKCVLREVNIKFFSPKDDNKISTISSFSERQRCFERNIREIDKCDFMIANTRDKDIGTLIEIGIAYSKSKPVILFTPQLKGLSINLMLSQLAMGIAFNKDELNSRLAEFLSGRLSPEFKGAIE